jgi:SAM-dependent methyltransferase
MKIFISPDSPFLTTDTRANRWAIPYHSECVNGRIDVLLDRNRSAIDGKNILDVGSHIGTFAYAALKLGGRFVHGLDTEEYTIERCKNLFQGESVLQSNYKFEVGNVFDFLESVGENAFDTILCFGMLYYTTEPYRLLELMMRTAKETVLLDTFTAAYAAVQGKDAPSTYPHLTEDTLKLPLMVVSPTQTEKKDYRLPESFKRKGRNLSLTTLPTRALLELWFESIGLNFEQLDWSDYITQPCTFHDVLTPAQKQSSHWADVYSSGIRVSYSLKNLAE